MWISWARGASAGMRVKHHPGVWRCQADSAGSNFHRASRGASPFPFPRPDHRRAHPRRVLRGGRDPPDRPRRGRPAARRGGAAAAGALGGGHRHTAGAARVGERHAGRSGGARRAGGPESRIPLDRPRLGAPRGVGGRAVLDLLIGSEGTLALVTAVRWRLEPIPPDVAGAALGFGSLEALGQAVPFLIALNPSAVELLDRTFLDLARRDGLELPAGI